MEGEVLRMWTKSVWVEMYALLTGRGCVKYLPPQNKFLISGSSLPGTDTVCGEKSVHEV
jgi:hypothetical protein